MTIGKTYHYGREDGMKGVEADYMLDEDGTLHIKIVGSNHWTDYVYHVVGAWPRTKRIGGIKVHRIWHRQALALSKRIIDMLWENHHTADRFNITGYSYGGAVAALLAAVSVATVNGTITIINAPKCGNKAAMWRLRRNVTDLNVLYDKGDIVHWLPFLYCNYPLRSRRSYGHTRGIGKAHNNMPDEWADFPI